jgi:hypothetical protein
MPDEPTIPDLSGGVPASDAPPPSTVAELIRAERASPSYDGLGTTAPSEAETDTKSSVDPNTAYGPNSVESTPILDPDSVLILEPEDDPLPYDDSEAEELFLSVTERNINGWNHTYPGNYNRTVMFGDYEDQVTAMIYYQNSQPFAVEIIDHDGDAVTISTVVLGHIAVLAQQFSGGGAVMGMQRNFRQDL